jgi:excisionase family DNA binding protein
MPRPRHKVVPPGPRWALFPEAVAYAAVSANTMRDWIRDGRLPAYRIGPRLLQVDLDDVDALRRRVPTVEPRGRADRKQLDKAATRTAREQRPQRSQRGRAVRRRAESA